jgi:ATP-dependent Clp protease adapter protein ClpS
MSEVTYNNYTPDSIVQTIIDKFVARAEFGEKKYGVTLDRDDLSIEDFIQHALEEHMDAILYLQKIKTMLEKEKK